MESTAGTRRPFRTRCAVSGRYPGVKFADVVNVNRISPDGGRVKKTARRSFITLVSYRRCDPRRSDRSSYRRFRPPGSEGLHSPFSASPGGFGSLLLRAGDAGPDTVQSRSRSRRVSPVASARSEHARRRNTYVAVVVMTHTPEGIIFELSVMVLGTTRRV